jgi:hypothetical protein
MSVLVNLRKHYQAKDAESGSSFDPPAIPFILKASSLKTENAQEFTLRVSPMEKNLHTSTRRLPSATEALRMFWSGKKSYSR